MKTLTLLSFLLIGISVSCQNAPIKELAIGDKAPELSFKTPEGKTLALSSFKGDYLLIDFWASWCPDCRALNPTMVTLYNKYKDKNIDFLGVSFDTDKGALDKYLSTSGITWTQVSEFKKWKETEISKKYGIKWIPTIYIIDKKGKVVFTSLDEKGLDEKLSELLK